MTPNQTHQSGPETGEKRGWHLPLFSSFLYSSALCGPQYTPEPVNFIHPIKRSLSLPMLVGLPGVLLYAAFPVYFDLPGIQLFLSGQTCFL